MAAPEFVNPSEADALAIEAIRRGDRDRYRELVERYADKVFAVAWCRLGDRTLAEEAAQEAFIAGFRRLSLLTHAERFGAWIATIARRTAINLGIRHRSEIQRRERWALEHQDTAATTPPHSAPADDPSPATATTLQDTLATLPPTHRECLVLFYLERRSIAEAADTLGISEGAFKVRLHRARSAMRDALEDRLETGLERLRAPQRLSSSVMVALPAAAPGALTAGGLWGVLTKALPFGWSLFLIQLLMLLPGLALAHWLGQKEIANVRDPSGPLARELRRDLRRRLWFTLLAVVGSIVAIRLLLGSVYALGYGRWLESMGGFQIVVAALGGILICISLPHLARLRWIRSPYTFAMGLWPSVAGACLLGAAIGDWPNGVLFMVQALLIIGSTSAHAAAHTSRNTLLHRAACGSIGTTDTTGPLPPTAPTSTAQTLAFARFLGRRQDITHAYPDGDRWILVLPPQRLRWTDAFRFNPDRGTSRVTLHRAGLAEVFLSARDARDLARVLETNAPPTTEIEQRAEHAIKLAWRRHACGDEAGAIACLAGPPTASPFVVPPEKSSAWRLRVRTTRILATLCFALGAYDAFLRPSPGLARIQHLKPVAITETEVQTFLASLDPGEPNHAAATQEWSVIAQTAWQLPGPGLFTDTALRKVQSNALTRLPYLGSTPPPAPEHVLRGVCFDPVVLNLGISGLLAPDALAREGLSPVILRQGLRRLTPIEHAELFELHELPIVIDGERRRYLWVESLARRVALLRRWGCAEDLDLRQAAQVLIESQVLPGHFPTNRWGATYAKSLQGLFATGRHYVLVETAFALEILEAAHALDRIDREACIQGILRFHHGQGRFAAKKKSLPGSFSGDHRDTFAAFRALRTLGALDRVKDLRTWELRPPFVNPIREHKDGTRCLSLEHLEAYCLREAFLRDRDAGQRE